LLIVGVVLVVGAELVVGVEHDVVGEQLRASVKELGERLVGLLCVGVE
jgi:hypothetical protein